MWYRQLPLILAVVTVLFGVRSGLAGSQSPAFTFTLSSWQLDSPIEPFSTGWYRSADTRWCTWDPDDHIAWTDNTSIDQGNLPAGYSTSLPICMIASDPSIVVYATHLLINITSGSPNLAVDVTYSPPGRSFHVLPVPDGHGFRYYACIMGPTWMDPNTVPLESFPDTNGGTGVRVTATVTVGNPTLQTIRKTDGAIVAERMISCESGPYDYADPGFRWTSQVVSQ